MTATTPDRSENPPIYDSLVAEHGDVLAEARKTAQTTQAEAARALDWSDLHPAEAEEEEAEGSAPGSAVPA